ncbi:MAG: aminoglycoside phosphotransferase family protein [Phormidesmis sp. RL_2_1]|nr:aminoglycoside phosphotransferase family protein [Phormidesmis sp. RL_2_1]
MVKGLKSVLVNSKSLSEIAQQFVKYGDIEGVTALGHGNINSTFLVTVSAVAGHPTLERFVLQRINRQVFRQPERVIHNMVALGDYWDGACQQKTGHKSAGLPRRWEIPRILQTNQGQNYWIDEAGDYWRAISFIEDAQVCESVESVAHAQEIGYGLAMFHKLMSKLPTDTLADTLEGFHITPAYLTEYEQVSRDRLPLDDIQTSGLTEASGFTEEQTLQISYCRAFIEARKAWADVLEKAKAAGRLKLRPIHGDPKVNNIMMAANGQAVSLIDLDTFKPGLLHYDIGDCLRSGCNRLGEETEDWHNVVFDVDLAKAMLKGYLSLAKDFWDEQDYDYLYDAIRLMAFELGLRFFTDYLAGDVYFKVKHSTHNLARALVQFKLTESIEAQADILRTMIQEMR